jgi:glycine hydroxymethyltransferase
MQWPLIDSIERYERYRTNTLNLIPSENLLSPAVRRALGSQMAGRYAGRPESYGGSRLFHKIWMDCESLACSVFDCKAVSVAPVSGHIAGMMALDSLTQAGDIIAIVSSTNGGYKGYNDGYIPEVMRLRTLPLPFDAKKYSIDLEGSLKALEEEKPAAVVLGGTVFLFPQPVKEISDLVHSYGGKVIYDGSHVLGLIAGGEFQQPLAEGADVLLGSTHKTLFGPQGGMILSNDSSVIKKIEERYLYRFVDNFQLNRVAALAVALMELKRHRGTYARRVVQNSQALAKRLYELGLPVAAKETGFTRSHQVLLSYDGSGEAIRDTLESNLIICDSRVRLGTNEVTRRGMGLKDMNLIAELVARGVAKEKDAQVIKSVRSLVSRYRTVKYTLEN